MGAGRRTLANEGGEVRWGRGGEADARSGFGSRESDRDDDGLTVTSNRELDGVARRMCADGDDQPGCIGNVLTVHRRNDVTGLESGSGCRATGSDVLNSSTIIRVLHVELHADDRCRRCARVDEFVCNALCRVDRNRKAKTDGTRLATALSSGPPELPGLIAASVWIALMNAVSPSPPAVTGRLSALTMPEVTVPCRPSGDPTAMTESPTLSPPDEPTEIAGRPVLLTLTTARS